MTPRILISGSDESRVHYENAVVQSGGTFESYYLPPLDDSFDALILCGGNDIAPHRYGQENTDCVDLDEARDEREIALLQMYLEAKKPILGICRGMQLINVVLGGDLKQDIGEVLHFFHSHQEKPDYKAHPVRTTEKSLMRKLYGDVFTVNSFHHQALDHLGTGLQATALSESGLIEAVEHKNLPILGVQWHPEQLCWEKSRVDAADGAPIFHWFISLCANHIS